MNGPSVNSGQALRQAQGKREQKGESTLRQAQGERSLPSCGGLGVSPSYIFPPLLEERGLGGKVTSPSSVFTLNVSRPFRVALSEAKASRYVANAT